MLHRSPGTTSAGALWVGGFLHQGVAFSKQESEHAAAPNQVIRSRGPLHRHHGRLGRVAFAQTPRTPPDNTKVNTRDRAKGAVTADQQKENAGDRELTQRSESR
jgi:hypothetical protein